jgi:hypothetical protein
MRLTLIVLNSPWTGKEIGIRHLPFFIGGSKRYAALLFHDGQFYLRDLGSPSGSIVDGQLIRRREAVVGDGSALEVGPLKFLVRLTGAVRPTHAGEGPNPRASASGAVPGDAEPGPPSPTSPPAGPDKEGAGKPPAKSSQSDTSRLAGQLLRDYLRKMKQEGSR